MQALMRENLLAAFASIKPKFALGNDYRKFGLDLHPEKTRLIEFGRYAVQHRKKQWEKKTRNL
jgi:hypothetical protein